MHSESESFSKIKHYREQLPQLFDKILDDLKVQLENLCQLKNEISLEIE